MKLFGPVLASASLLLSASTSQAQCPGPDNLDGPCWNLVSLNVPQFPAFVMNAAGICWTDCSPDPKQPVRVQWPAPAPTAVCSEFLSPITVFDAGGLPILVGDALMNYTRTWGETDPAGIDHQVWRFAVRVDLSPIAGGAASFCPVPSCIPPLGPHPTAYFYGYVDYALDCAAGSWEQVIVLYHNCDDFIHDPALSNRPGVFHPVTSYAVIGPDTAVNPFVPVPVPPPGGPVVAEAVRNLPNPFGVALCTAEEKAVSGNLLPLFQGCFCPLGFAPGMQSANLFDGFGTCLDSTGAPSSWKALLINFPTIPWPFMLSSSLGSWTTASSYPGQENAFVNEGLFRYYDSCSSRDSVEIFYGGATTEGWLVIPTPVDSLTQNFVDLVDNRSIVVGTPVLPPFVGSVNPVDPTDHLIYVNTP